MNPSTESPNMDPTQTAGSGPRITCAFPVFCKHLDERIADEANARKTGFVLTVLSKVDCDHDDPNRERIVGVAYRKNARDQGLFINVCPFCGADISQGIKQLEAEADAHAAKKGP